MSNKKKNAANEAVTEPKFTKTSLVCSVRFRDKRDLLSALLGDSVEYTISEVEDMIAKYEKGKVK